MLTHLDDLASDFSAIHRIPDMTVLPGHVFFKLAWRIGAYQGVIRERLAGLAAADEPDTVSPRPRAAAGRRDVPATVTAIRADPVLSSLISFG